MSALAKPRKTYSVYLTRGKSNGEWSWQYVKIDPLKQPLFERALRGASIDVSEYGEVLFSGWGEHPPQTVAEYISKHYS